MKTLKFLFALLSIFSGLNILIAQDSLQTIQPDSAKPTLKFNFSHPEFDKKSGASLTFLSGVYDIGGNLPVGANISICANLPFSVYGSKNESIQALGNIYFGIEKMVGNDRKSTFEAGVFIPTADKSTEGMVIAIISGASDIYNIQKYIPGVTTLYLNYNLKNLTGSDFYYGVGIGDKYLIPEDGNPMNIFQYKLFGGYAHPGRIGIEGGFHGFMVMAEHSDGETMNIINTELFYEGNSVRPGLFLKFPLGEYGDVVNSLFGFNIQFRFD